MRQVEEEFAVSYITSFEETGLEKGLQQGIAALLRVRFGADSASLIEEIRHITDLATLEAVLAQAETAPTLDAIRQIYAGSAGS
jgi:hypothetical protein